MRQPFGFDRYLSLPFAIYELIVLIKERYHLASQAVAVGTECSVIVTFEDLLLGSPQSCLVEVVALLDIGELILLGRRLGLACKSPQERYRMAAGAYDLWSEGSVLIAFHDMVLVAQMQAL